MELINGDKKSTDNDNIKNVYQKLWPCLLFLIPVVVVLAGVAVAFIDEQKTDQSYFLDEIPSSHQIEQIDHAKSLDIQAHINIDVSVWQLTLNSNERLNDTHLIVELQHKSISDANTTLTLFNAGNGHYRGTLSDIDAGLWNIEIYPKAQVNKKIWRLKGEINLSDATTTLNNG